MKGVKRRKRKEAKGQKIKRPPHHRSVLRRQWIMRITMIVIVGSGFLWSLERVEDIRDIHRHAILMLEGKRVGWCSGIGRMDVSLSHFFPLIIRIESRKQTQNTVPGTCSLQHRTIGHFWWREWIASHPDESDWSGSYVLWHSHESSGCFYPPLGAKRPIRIWKVMVEEKRKNGSIIHSWLKDRGKDGVIVAASACIQMMQDIKDIERKSQKHWSNSFWRWFCWHKRM